MTTTALVVLGIDYDEFGGSDSYKGVTISKDFGNAEERVFSGDVVADFRAAIEKLAEEDKVVIMSSTCDHFVHDTKEFKWSDDTLIVRK